MDDCLVKAENLLKENENKLDDLAEALLEEELLNAQEIEKIMEAEKVVVPD